MRLFLGKFSNKYPEQIEKKYAAAGEKGNSWYGEVEPGDYVFPAYEGKIVALWKAKGYGKLKNTVNPKDDGVLFFDEIKKYDDVSIANDFTRYKYFIHDLNLVNKVIKSVKGLGFIPIKTTNDCPPNPEDIDFKSGVINIYIALDNVDVNYKEGDIIVTIDNIGQMKITGIDRFEKDQFKVYESLNDLYEEKNSKDGKHTIRELSEYSLKDQAPEKRKFLITLIEELGSNGYYKVTSAIKLYDNLLVGRKRSVSAKSGNSGLQPDNVTTDEEVLEYDNEQYQKLAGLLNFNPNLILYGPPGTGKTYATRKIIDYFENKYFNTGGSYNAAEAENRVKMITFHQSYSYEEFIEGIRPILSEDGVGKVGYKLENGIFKELCINAEKELIKRQNNAEYVDMLHSESNIWKVSLGERKSDKIFNECIKEGDIAIDWLDKLDLSNMSYDDILAELGDESNFGNKPTQDANSINYFVNDMTVGDVVLVYDGTQTIRMIGVITGQL